jgi:hypothetical protein
MMPPLWFLSYYINNQYGKLLIVQIVGAFIFYSIDKYIFEKVSDG